MKIRNKDIVLSNKNGFHQRISFHSDGKHVHIWYDHINDEIIINQEIEYQFKKSGEYKILLTVGDNNGEERSVEIIINVGADYTIYIIILIILSIIGLIIWFRIFNPKNFRIKEISKKQ